MLFGGGTRRKKKKNFVHLLFGTKKAPTDKIFTGWRGLCCIDRIPSNEVFFSLIQSLDDMLSRSQIDKLDSYSN